jgi:hypothetical protein
MNCLTHRSIRTCALIFETVSQTILPMNRRTFLRIAQGAVMGSSLRAATSGAGAPALSLVRGPQLFLDDFLIERLDGLRREIHPPQRHGSPVLDNKTFGVTQPYLTVLRDPAGKTFRMFYNRGPAIWHAESEDGIAWGNQRVAYNCPRGYGCSIVYDGEREPDPGRRFKLAHWSGTPGKGDKPGDDTGMWIGFSPDGFDWKLHPGNPVLPTWPEGYDQRVAYGIGDTVDVYFDPLAGRYRAAVKVNALPEDGFAPGPKSGRGIRRLVGMSASPDFVAWERPHRILVPDGRDEGLLEFYGMGAMHIRGGLHIGFARILHDDFACDPGGPKDGIGYAVLVTSRDAVTWQRDRLPFLDRNLEPGSWDHAMTWISAAVPVGDELFLYYGGYARGHKIQAATERQIGLARMKRDRYAALVPVNGSGTFLTRPFVHPGGALTVNADAAHGEIRVRIAGGPEARPVTVDALDAPMEFSEPPNSLKGKTMQLEFTLRTASLFAFEFR